LKVPLFFASNPTSRESRVETARDGFNRSQRIIQLVSQYANQPLPRPPFLFTQRAAHIGQYKKRVGDSLLTKGASPDEPPGIGSEMQLNQGLVFT